jgi:ankyrin repeat protein
MSAEFFQAIRQGNLAEVQRLLTANPSLVHEKEDGLSPIMVAAYQSHTDIAEFLADKTGNLTIYEYAALGKVNQVSLLLARDPALANAYSDDGFQPLGVACFCGQYEVAEFLIKVGASINSPSRNEQNTAPLQSAVAMGHFKITTLLLDNDADPNVRDQNGYTPLHTAAQTGNLDVIRALLFNGAILTTPSRDGKLPIDMANEAGHKQAASLLKEGITRRFRTRRFRL